MVQAPKAVRCRKGCRFNPGDILRAGAQMRAGGVIVTPVTAAMMFATTKTEGKTNAEADDSGESD